MVGLLRGARRRLRPAGGDLLLAARPGGRPRHLPGRRARSSSLFVAGWRIAFEWLSSRMGPHERVLIVGTSAAAIGTGARDLRAPAPARRRVHRLRRSAGRRAARSRPRRHHPRQHARHPGHRPRPRRRSRGRQPRRCARQDLDGRAAPHEAERRGALRPPRVGLRGVHRQDRRREPASELVRVLRGLPQGPPARPRQARPGCRRLRRLAVRPVAGDGAGRPRHPPDLARPGLLSPGASRHERPRLHGPQVPVDARRRGERHRRGLVARRRSARDAGSGASSAARGSTSCRSSGTSSPAT